VFGDDCEVPPASNEPGTVLRSCIDLPVVSLEFDPGVIESAPGAILFDSGCIVGEGDLAAG
jgi:hypothetical protein